MELLYYGAAAVVVLLGVAFVIRAVQSRKAPEPVIAPVASGLPPHLIAAERFTVAAKDMAHWGMILRAAKHAEPMGDREWQSLGFGFSDVGSPSPTSPASKPAP